MKYCEPKAYDHNEIIKIESRNDVDEISNMLIGVSFNENDFQFAFNLISKYTESKSDVIAGAALESIAHLARRFKYLPSLEMIKIFQKCKNRLPSEEISWGLELLEEDLKIYVPDLSKTLFP